LGVTHKENNHKTDAWDLGLKGETKGEEVPHGNKTNKKSFGKKWQGKTADGGGPKPTREENMRPTKREVTDVGNYSAEKGNPRIKLKAGKGTVTGATYSYQGVMGKT